MSSSATLSPTFFDARQRWFGLDAAVTGLNALGYVVLGAWLSEQFGTSATTYRVIGGALLLFAISVGLYAAREREPRWCGWSIVAVNVAWVAASLVVAAAGLADVNGLGRTWIACQAVVVAALTVMQASTIRER